MEFQKDKIWSNYTAEYWREEEPEIFKQEFEDPDPGDEMSEDEYFLNFGLKKGELIYP